MNLADTPTQAARREEIRDWLAEHLTGEFARHPGVGGPTDDSWWDLRLAWERELADGGWLGITWPVEYGGRGGTLEEELVFLEEHFRARAPYWVGVHGRDLFEIKPAFIRLGSLLGMIGSHYPLPHDSILVSERDVASSHNTSVELP